MPGFQTQVAIVKHIDETLKSIHFAVNRTEREIELLCEYRTRLIADVVTGKLDVREAVANLPEEADEAEDLMDEGETMADDLDAATEEAEE